MGTYHEIASCPSRHHKTHRARQPAGVCDGTDGRWNAAEETAVGHPVGDDEDDQRRQARRYWPDNEQTDGVPGQGKNQGVDGSEVVGDLAEADPADRGGEIKPGDESCRRGWGESHTGAIEREEEGCNE